MPSEMVEYRDPSGATQPLRFIGVGQPQVPQWNAERAVTDGLLASVWVYRCANAVASALSQLPFRAGPDPDDPTNYNRDARLAQLLGPPPGGPNIEWSARGLLHYSVVQYLITGRFGWEIETSGANGKGDVVALWPLVAARLRPIPTTSGSRYFARFEYGSDNNPVKLARESVFYHWKPSALDVREPESVLQAAALDVSIEVMANRFGFGFLKNDARPAAMVVHPPFANQDDYEAWKRQWDLTFRGPDNAGRMAFMETDGDEHGQVAGAVDIKNLGTTQRDAQMAEQQEAKIRAICAAFGVPLTVLADASNRTFSNAAEEVKVFWTQTMMPLLADVAEAINMRLAPRLGTDVGWFDLSTVEALQSKVQPVTSPVGAPELVRSRLITIDEARADYGYAPLEDGSGDRLMTADELAILNPASATVLPQAGRHLRVLPTHQATRAGLDSEERRERLWRAADAGWRTFESLWKRQLVRMFERQRTQAIKRLRGNTRAKKILGGTTAEARAAAGDVFDPAFWQAETTAEVTGLYESVTAGAFSRLTDQLGISFDLEAEFAQQFVLDRANQLGEQITTTTYSQITEQLAEGVGAGESIDDLADRVEAVFDQATGARAEVIARTEVVSASNGASMAAAGSLPADVVAGAEWVAARDPRTRESHASVDNLVVPIGQPFPVGGSSMAYPGDPAGPAGETINCRCTVAFLTPEEMAA